MSSTCVVDRLLDGRLALEGSRWDEARAAFEDALAEQETPEALDGLGQALWFLGQVAEGVAARERAFDGFARDDAATRPRASPSGSRTSTSSPAVPPPRAGG